MEHQITVTQEAVKVRVIGRLSSEAAESLGQELMTYVEKKHGTYVIDMSELSYIGSAGIGILISLNKHARSLGGSLTVVGARGHIRDLFEMTMMNTIKKLAATKNNG